MATSTVLTNKPINPRGDDNRPVDSYNRASLYSGKALDFDGVNDNISIPQFTFTAGNKYSLCIYANRDNNGLIWSRDNQWMEIKFNAGALELRTYDTAWNTYTLIDDVPANEWHQIIVTYDVDGNIWKSYLNGQFIKSVTAAEATNKHINRIGSSAGAWYDGEFANAKIFEVELTAAQVADLYNNPEKIVPTGVSNDALKLWLPMMEGAGTTVYDGSGNGNHGTINGATWTHGIGSPVAQTAVIDWNKLYVFDKVDDYASTASYNDVSGTKTYKVSFEIFDTSTDEQQVFQLYNTIDGKGAVATYNAFGTSKRLGFRGYASGADFGSSSWNDVERNTPYELVFTINWDTGTLESISLNGDSPQGATSARLTTTIDGLVVGYRWNTYYLGGIINYFEVVGEEKWTNASGFKSESGSYDMAMTGSPAQILAPQGLTTGRDITGVNLFENVRKQGALNLDGKSWAEVHDNGSLDITDAISVECWIYFDSSGNKGLLSKWNGAPNQTYLLYKYTGGVQFYISSTGSNSSYISGAISTDGWHHVVGTDDGTTQKIYIDSVLKNNTPSLGSIFSNSSVVEIGRYNLDTNTQYPNNIAQPRIYNRALTASEVLNNYNATKDLYI